MFRYIFRMFQKAGKYLCSKCKHTCKLSAYCPATFTKKTQPITLRAS